MIRAIAVTGESCTRKTTIARLLASHFKCSVRHCGEIAKCRANELGVHVADLPEDEHRVIDDETKRIIEETERLIIVEGRYLLEILKSVKDVVRIELQCSDRERHRRKSSRESSIDPRSRIVRENLWEGYDNDPLAIDEHANLIVDTSDPTPEDIADQIVEFAMEYGL